MLSLAANLSVMLVLNYFSSPKKKKQNKVMRDFFSQSTLFLEVLFFSSFSQKMDMTISQLKFYQDVYTSTTEDQKQQFRGVLGKMCSENKQQIYRRAPRPKCDFNKFALQLYWNRIPKRKVWSHLKEMVWLGFVLVLKKCANNLK